MSERTDAILRPEHSGLPDWQVSDILNAETIQVDGDSSLLRVQNALAGMGAWGQIEDDSINDSDRNKRVFLLNVLCLFRAPSAESIGWGDDPSYPTIISDMLDGLIVYGYVDINFKNFVMSQRYVSKPKWDPPFTAREVGLVRGFNPGV
jgi:hypothetical protein